MTVRTSNYADKGVLIDMGTTTLGKFYPILVIAVVEIASAPNYGNAFFCAFLAMLGGGMMQIRRSEKGTLSAGQMVAEWGLSWLAGLAAYGPATYELSDVSLVWTACIFAGCAGSEGLHRYIAAKQKTKK